MLCPSLPIDEIRRRIREAEALLRVATQHARDAREDPSKSEYASARIQAICREVEEMFPGMHDSAGPDPEVVAAMAQLQLAAPAVEPAEDAATEEPDADASPEEDEDAGDEGEEEEAAQEWDVDYAKLGAAIENEELMSQFPEPARSAFRRAARYLVDSHERQELFARVVHAFEELSALTSQSVEETQRKLAMAMTLENLASKNKA